MSRRQKSPGPYPNRLAEVRHRRGMTQHELEAASGIGRDYIQKLESGRVWLSPEKLRALSSALDCGWWELMPDAPDLSEQDIRLISALRRMGPDGQQKLMAWIETALAALAPGHPQ